MDALISGKETKQIATAWDDYANKYNRLADILLEKGIDNCLLDEVIKSRANLIKACLTVKLEEISRF